MDRRRYETTTTVLEIAARPAFVSEEPRAGTVVRFRFVVSSFGSFPVDRPSESDQVVQVRRTGV